MFVRGTLPNAIISFFLLLLLPDFAGSARATDEYTLGVVPQMPPVAMHTAWTPFVDRLTQETGLAFKLKVYETMDAFEKDFQAGTPDFIFSSPAQIALAHRTQGYIPLVRNSLKIKGILYVRQDSPITRLDQLDGKNIAFVGAKSLCSIIVKQRLAELTDAITYQSVYSGSSDNVYKSLILGKADAGATLEIEVGQVSPEVSKLLRPLMTSEDINPHPFCAHPRVPEEVRRTIKEAVLHLGADSTCQDLLKTIRLPSPVAADYARDYQGIEKLTKSSVAPPEL